MAKKKSTWLSPTKQKILDDKLQKEKNVKIAMFILLGVAILTAIGVMVMGIVMANRPYYADIEVEGYGVITIELNEDVAPITVKNFVNLAKQGFYNGTTFYLVAEGEMICGGKPKDGNFPPSIKGEFEKNGVQNTLSHVRGTISMNRKKKTTTDENDKVEDYYNTGTCEFFIMQTDNFKLDGQYATFGTVIKGMDIVDKICSEVETIEGTGGSVAKENQPIIKSITIKRTK